MKILAFDSVGGAAGDMILASMIDLGVDPQRLTHDLSTLGIGTFQIQAQPCSASGIHGLRLNLRLPSADPDPAENTGSAGAHAHPHDDDHGHDHTHPHPHGHDHAHSHRGHDPDPHHDHGHEHGHAHGHGHAKPSLQSAGPHTAAHNARGLRDIRRLIEASALPSAVKDSAITVFQRLAEAEARVHHCDPETIHFHEVGALDSILDIVGCCLARYRLGIEAVHVSPLPLGTGTFRCDHGILPIPAPATAALLRDMPVIRTDEPYELVTPTGAAILSAWRTTAQDWQAYRIQRVGHGFGTRTLRNRPNMLRATLMTLDTPDVAPEGGTACLELVCNLDDMTPEWIGPLIPRLLDEGALEAFVTPVHMKKMRPGWLLTVLCRPGDRDRFMALLFSETTTFGIRWRLWERETLDRKHHAVDTPYGSLRIKVGSRRGRDCAHAPEYEDCRKAALAHHVPVREVYASALAAFHSPPRTE